MYYTLVYLAAFTVSAVAQGSFFSNFYKVPDCARSCAANLPASCAGNPRCICEDTAWIDSVACCASQSCSSADQAAGFQFATQICSYVNVTITRPSRCSTLTKQPTTATTTTTLQPSTSTTTVATAAATTVAGYVAQGCYSEATAHTTGQRALNVTHNIDKTGMTVSQCVGFCSSQGLSIAGLEHGQECWCGDAIVNGGAKLTDQSGCNTPCKGNSAETCGGSWTLEVYQRG